MIPVGHPSTDFVNVTAHIYSDQSVEYHYGPSQVIATTAFNGGTGPSVFLILFQGVFGTPVEYHKMIGSPSNPTFGTAPSQSKLTAVPAEGTLYRYEPFNIGFGKLEINDLKIFPNPVKDVINLEGQEVKQVEIFALNGSLLMSAVPENGRVAVDVLDKGTYVLGIKNEDELTHYLKFVKQ
jgi:hypothetical protein